MRALETDLTTTYTDRVVGSDRHGQQSLR